LGRILAANNFYQNVFMLVALIATASLSYLQFDSGDILLIAATIQDRQLLTKTGQ
jgi:hypothetical protein